MLASPQYERSLLRLTRAHFPLATCAHYQRVSVHVGEYDYVQEHNQGDRAWIRAVRGGDGAGRDVAAGGHQGGYRKPREESCEEDG